MARNILGTLMLSTGLAFLASSGAEAQIIIKVNEGLGTGNNDGTTWDDAFRGPQALTMALGQAQASDQVWGAAGTYKPPTQGASFVISSGVKIYGGFPTTGDPGLDDRNPDPETNGTVLDGDINGDDSGFNNYSDNCFVVVSAPSVGGVAQDTVLDGFTIRGAQQHGVMNVLSVLTYTNLLITENQWVTDTFGTVDGAGMYCNNNSDVVVTQTIFRNNRLVGPDDASGYGTAIAIYSGSDISMTDCVIEDNLNDLTTPWGGGMYSEYSSPTLRRVVFSNNECRGASGDGEKPGRQA